MKKRKESRGVYEYIEEIIIICVIILILIFVYVHFDKKAENVDREYFRNSLSKLNEYKYLTDENRTSLIEKAMKEYDAKYNKGGKFIGGSLSALERQRIVDDYMDEAHIQDHENYQKKIK